MQSPNGNVPLSSDAHSRWSQFLQADDEKAWAILEQGIESGISETLPTGTWLGACCPLVVSSLGFNLCCLPLLSFCPGTLYKKFSGLRINQQRVSIRACMNTFCCLTNDIEMEVLLEEVAHWGEYDTCCSTEFRVSSKRANQGTIQNTNVVGQQAEIFAGWLANTPEITRAMDKAVRLHRHFNRTNITVAPQIVIPAGAIPAAAPPATSMADRVARLDALIARGVLSASEAGPLRVAMLTSEPDPTQRLTEIADLYAKGAVSKDDFAALRNKVISSLA